MARILVVLFIVAFGQFCEARKNCPKVAGAPGASVANHLPTISAKNTEQTCRKVDLRKKLPPTRQQGMTGWCYAMSIADLLSVQLGINVSGPDIAINYQNRDPNASKEFKADIANPCRDPNSPEADSQAGGIVSDVLDAVRKAGGACPDANLPDHENFSAAILEVEHQIEAKKVSRSPHNLDEPLKELAPRANRSQIERALRVTPAWKAYSEIDHDACDGKRIPIPDNLKMISVDLESPEEADSPQEYLQQFDTARVKIDSLLNQHTPVSYGSYFYFDDPESKAYAYNLAPESDMHQTTIIGRKWNKERKTCTYEIRNNWGNDPCDSKKNMELYHKCDAGGKCSTEVVTGLYDCDPNTGTLWLTESEMLSALVNYHWVVMEKAKKKVK